MIILIDEILHSVKYLSGSNWLEFPIDCISYRLKCSMGKKLVIDIQLLKLTWMKLLNSEERNFNVFKLRVWVGR